MKHIYQSIMKSCLGLCTLLVMVSCGDFLEITPRDLVTEDNFWDEKKDVDQMVAGCYTAMQNVAFMERCIVWGEMRGDDVDGNNVNSITDIYNALINNYDEKNVYCDWTSFYYVINKCNTIIRMAPEVSAKDPAYRESDVKATIAEVTALRSLCYWYLIRTFKDVPFSRDAIQQEDEVHYLLAPTGFDQVLNNLIADLESVKDNALDHFPTTSSDNVGQRYNSNCNRITRNAIRAMLCDMYLWRGDYDLAIQCVNEILEVKKKEAEKLTDVKLYTGLYNNFSAYLYDPQYSIYAPNYSFQTIFGNNGNSYESIFELSFNYNGPGSPYIMNTALGRFYGSGITTKTDGLEPNSGAGWLRVMSNIVADGQKSSGWQVYRGRSDIRFYCSLRAVDKEFGEAFIRKGVATDFDVTNTTPYENYNPYNFFLPTVMNRNWIFYRLTDVILMGAEAYIMKSGGTLKTSENLQKAADLLDIVNQRSVLQYNDQLRKTDFSGEVGRGTMLDLVRQERRCELMFEGKRYFDIIRYCKQDGNMKEAKKMLPKCNSVSPSNAYDNPGTLYWPYYRDERLKNPELIGDDYYFNELINEASSEMNY